MGIAALVEGNTWNEGGIVGIVALLEGKTGNVVALIISLTVSFTMESIDGEMEDSTGEIVTGTGDGNKVQGGALLQA